MKIRSGRNRSGVTSSDYKGLERAIEKALAKEKREPEELWIARFSLLKIKPIISKDPILFKDMIDKLKNAYPYMVIYIFRFIESKGEDLDSMDSGTDKTKA